MNNLQFAKESNEKLINALLFKKNYQALSENDQRVLSEAQDTKEELYQSERYWNAVINP